jgi:hypothetical protein
MSSNINTQAAIKQAYDYLIIGSGAAGLMGKFTSIFILFLFLFPALIYAETPSEIQGVWVPDVEKSITLIKQNIGELDEPRIAFFRNHYLPYLKRTITKNQIVTISGKREFKADISLKEKQGRNFIMLLTGETAPSLVLTFIPKENGEYIMVTEHPSDGSGNILWKRK